MFLAKLPYNTTQLEIQCLITCSTEYPEYENGYFFYFGATAPIWALAYLRETLRFTTVY
jgi:hypothetical protein